MATDEDKTRQDIDAFLGQARAISRLQQAKQQFQQGRLVAAAALAEGILNDFPAHAEANHLLGVIVGEQGDYARAIQLQSRAVESNPDQPVYHYNLGLVLYKGRQPEAALVAFNQAARLKPSFYEAHTYVAAILRELGRLDEALKAFERVIELQPQRSEVHTNRATVLRDLGRMEEAEAACRRALELNPDDYEVYRHLMSLHKAEPGDPLVETIEKLYNRPDAGPELRLQLGFTLGKAYNDLGQYPQASACYREANRLKRATFAYSVAEDTVRGAYLREVFTPAYIRHHSASGVSDTTPLFVIGMPRSGTTLVEQILASHPAVTGAGELPFMNYLALQGGGSAGPEGLAWLADPASGVWRSKGAEYLQYLHTRVGETSQHITDKMPLNFWYVGLIRLMLPDARIIHVHRDARDTCLSIYTKLFSEHHPYAYEMAELGGYYREYEAMMAHWDRVFPGVVHTLEYEALVEDLEGEVRRLLAYCELPFDAQCLAFHETGRGVRTASFAQVRRPIYRDSVGRWQHYAELLQPLQTVLGSSE